MVCLASITVPIAGIVGSLMTFNLLGAAVAGFGFLQMGQDEVVGWLEG